MLDEGSEALDTAQSKLQALNSKATYLAAYIARKGGEAEELRSVVSYMTNHPLLNDDTSAESYAGAHCHVPPYPNRPGYALIAHRCLDANGLIAGRKAPLHLDDTQHESESAAEAENEGANGEDEEESKKKRPKVDSPLPPVVVAPQSTSHVHSYRGYTDVGNDTVFAAKFAWVRQAAQSIYSFQFCSVSISARPDLAPNSSISVSPCPSLSSSRCMIRRGATRCSIGGRGI